jgi:branched-chain amino acid transport system substrate-binding protein
MRHILLRFSLLLVASLVLTSCGLAPPAPVDEPRPAASDADAEKIIYLGAAVSETGRFSREGKDTRQGYLVWLDWVNNEYGGIKVGDERYKVEIVMYDDEGDPDTAARLVEKLINEDRVDFLLGPYSSFLTQSASAIAEKYGKIMIEGNGSAETLFERGFQNLFAVLTPAVDYTRTALQLLADIGAKTVVIAYEDTAFPTSVADGAQSWAAEYGLEVLGVETYPVNVADVSGIMSKFKELEPDIFVGGGHFNDAILFIRAAKELDFNPKAMVITVGPSNPKLIEEVGADAEYVIGPTQWEASMSYADDYFGTAAEYAARYEKMWGEPPTYQAAESTATALALHIAIEQAASLDTDAVRASLRNLDVVTFYGPINFDEKGRNASKPMGAIQIQNGDILVVAPTNAAVAELDYPAPAWKDR